ncbi:MAG: septation inhibitor protein [Bacillales bacterium]|jgi:cell division protein DivIC|nr:septation inhibitor protein [Bacillales bacterium]
MNSDYVKTEDKKRKTDERRRFVNNRKLFVVVIAFMILLTGTVYIRIIREQALAEKLNENKKLQTQLTNLKKEERNLNQEIVNLNDDEYVAKLARKEYYVSTNGEIIFSTPDNREDN